MTDFRGNEIKIGDTIVYPGRSGSCMWMNEGIVIGFYEYTVYWDKISRQGITVKRTDSGKIVRLQQNQRTCIIERENL